MNIINDYANLKNRIWNDDEIEINLKDMICHVVLGWKTIIAWMLILAALSIGFTAYKSNNKYQLYSSAGITDSDDATMRELKLELAEVEKEIGKEKFAQVEKEFTAYQEICSDYNQYEKYLESSLLLQLNPYSTPKKQLGFLVTTEAITTSTTITANDYYSDIIDEIINSFDDDFYEELLRKTQLETNINYIKELLRYDVSCHSAIITIYGTSEEFCSIIADSVQNKVSELMPELMTRYNGCRVTLTLDVYTESYDDDLFCSQNEIKNDLNEMKKACSDFRENYLEYFSSEQNDCFDILDEISRYNSKNTTENNHNSEDGLNFKIDVFDAKNFVAFAIAGACIGFCVQALRYVFSSKLKSSDEIKQATGTAILGILNIEKKIVELTQPARRYIKSLVAVSAQKLMKNNWTRYVPQ